MSELTTINTNNFSEMAKAMGMANDTTAKRGMFLSRLRIEHKAILGAESILVKAGAYKLETPDGPTHYAESAVIRPFLQRYMYKKFVMGQGGSPNRYVKTVMADNLNIDLKDDDGGFNCGKPAGWIQDYNALPQKDKDLIKSIKRVRVVFGAIHLVNPKDENGKPVEETTSNFIWEVENKEAFKTVGGIFTQLGKMKRLPPQHNVTLNTELRKIPSGNDYYVPSPSLDITNSIEITDEDQLLFGEFMGWLQNYNEYIINKWAEKSSKVEDDEDFDMQLNDIIDIEEDEVA